MESPPEENKDKFKIFMLMICVVLTSISAIYGVSLVVSGVINNYSKAQVKF